MLSSLTESQNQIKDAKTKLQETREALGSRRGDLAQLWTRGQTLDEMIKIIDEMFVPSFGLSVLLTRSFSEYLKTVPDTLESLISEKKLLQASSLLVRGLKIISKSDMQDIGALGDLRAYLTGQETVR